MIMLSVVIPTCHRNESLALCLEKLAPGKQTIDLANYEVVVSDDGFVTTAEAMIQKSFPWVTWTAGQQRGPAANRNNGAKKAVGDYLVFTDDDCVPDSGWLSAYIEAIAEYPNCQIFEGRTYADEPKKSLSYTSPINETGDRLYSCNLAIHSKLYAELGGFDTRFTHFMEDMDFAYRASLRGCKHQFVPAASVLHPWRRVGGWKQLQKMNIGAAMYLKLHPEELRCKSPYFYFKSSVAVLLRDLPRAFLLLDWQGSIWTVQKACSVFLLGLTAFRLRY